MQTGNSKYKTEFTESITKDTNMPLHFFSPVLSGLCRRAVSLAHGVARSGFFYVGPDRRQKKKIYKVWGHRTGLPLNHVYGNTVGTCITCTYVSTKTITVRLGI